MKSKHLASWLLLAVISVVFMASSSPQCVNSADVMGPDLGTLAKKVDCEKDCRMDRREAIRDERRRHRQALKACKTNEDAMSNHDDDSDPACIAEEDARHQAALAEIEEDYQHCLTVCAHQQGSGLGGQ